MSRSDRARARRTQRQRRIATSPYTTNPEKVGRFGMLGRADGPIEFRPTGQLELRRVRLLASVPQKAIGFTVSTPTSKIVDLETEFEVAVNEAEAFDNVRRRAVWKGGSTSIKSTDI